MVAIKITAGASAGKPQVPTPAGASPKRTAKGKSTGPTVATPSTKATPSPQSSIENKVSLILLYSVNDKLPWQGDVFCRLVKHKFFHLYFHTD